MSKDVQKAFGLKLREARKKKELTQEELAGKAGLHFTYVGQIERGKRNPSLINICKLIKALNVSPNDLIPA